MRIQYTSFFPEEANARNHGSHALFTLQFAPQLSECAVFRRYGNREIRRRARGTEIWCWTRRKVRTNMVAVLSWESLQCRRIVPGVSVAPKRLRMKNLDSAVQFIWQSALFDPIALIFVRPPHEVGSYRLWNATTRAATILDVEMSGRFCFVVHGYHR